MRGVKKVGSREKGQEERKEGRRERERERKAPAVEEGAPLSFPSA